MNLYLRKFDDELQVVYGEVYAPNVPDSQGDFMSEEEVRKMAHSFMKNMRVTKVDTQHDNSENGSIVVESFVAREHDKDFLPGSWVVGVHVPSADLWKKVKSGELNGFSLEAMVHSTPTMIEIEVPDVIEGMTMKSEDHTHKFFVSFNDEGQFIGGRTDEVNGHVHEIKKGTMTEPAGGHTHRYSFIEGLG